MEEHKVTRGYIVCLEDSIRKVCINDSQEIIIMPVVEFLNHLWEQNIENITI